MVRNRTKEYACTSAVTAGSTKNPYVVISGKATTATRGEQCRVKIFCNHIAAAFPRQRITAVNAEEDKTRLEPRDLVEDRAASSHVISS